MERLPPRDYSNHLYRLFLQHRRKLILGVCLSVFTTVFWNKVADIMPVLLVLATLGIIWWLFTTEVAGKWAIKSSDRIRGLQVNLSPQAMQFGVMIALCVVAIVFMGFVCRESIRSFVSSESNPSQDLIRAATATVDITVDSNTNVGVHFGDGSVGYLVFAKGNTSLLTCSSQTYTSKQIRGNRVAYHGVFDMDATSDATKQKIHFLRQTDYIQIGFSRIPDSQVIEGNAIVTINGELRLEFKVPPQSFTEEILIIPDVQKYIKSTIE